MILQICSISIFSKQVLGMAAIRNLNQLSRKLGEYMLRESCAVGWAELWDFVSQMPCSKGLRNDDQLMTWVGHSLMGRF